MNKSFLSGAVVIFLAIIAIVALNLKSDNKSAKPLITHTPKTTQATSDNSQPQISSPPISKQTVTSPQKTDLSNNSVDPMDKALDEMLRDNLVINGLPARKLKDGTVIIDTRGRLKTVSVATLNENGEVVISEHKESLLQLKESAKQ